MTSSLLHHLSHLPPDLTLLGEEGGEVHLHSLHLSLLSPSLAPLLAHQAGLTMAITLPTTPSTLAALHRVVLGETVTREEEEEVREVINLLGIHTNMLKMEQREKEMMKRKSKTSTQKINALKEEFFSQCAMESPELFGMEKVEILSNTLNELIKGEDLPENKTNDDCEPKPIEKEPEKVLFRCNICEKNLSTKGNLKTHNKARHNPDAGGRTQPKKTRTFQCENCVAAFRTPGQLKRHCRTKHENSGPLQCEVCSVMIENKDKLRQHRDNQHKERKYKCSMCDFKFSGPKKLDSHFLRAHTDLKKEECKVCGGFFNDVDEHYKRRHTDIKNKVCIVCGEVFKHLKNHLKRTACGLGKKLEAIFKCELCTKKFTLKDGLKRHLKVVHEKIKKYKCEQCEYRASSGHNLKLHQASIHTGVRPKKQQCPHCDKMLYDLEWHVSTYHSVA